MLKQIMVTNHKRKKKVLTAETNNYSHDMVLLRQILKEQIFKWKIQFFIIKLLTKIRVNQLNLYITLDEYSKLNCKIYMKKKKKYSQK